MFKVQNESDITSEVDSNKGWLLISIKVYYNDCFTKFKIPIRTLDFMFEVQEALLTFSVEEVWEAYFPHSDFLEEFKARCTQTGRAGISVPDFMASHPDYFSGCSEYYLDTVRRHSPTEFLEFNEETAYYWCGPFADIYALFKVICFRDGTIVCHISGTDDSSYSLKVSDLGEAHKELEWLRKHQPLDFHNDIIGRNYYFSN